MLQVQFNIGPTRDALRRAMAKLTDMTPIYTDIGEYLLKATKDRFKKGVAPDGQKWAPKKPATMERYRRMGYGNRPRPLIGPSGALSSQVQRNIGRDYVEIGSSRIYANVMQQGAEKGAFGADRHGRPIPWGRIPARAWLGISRDDERAIVEIVEEAIDGALTAG